LLRKASATPTSLFYGVFKTALKTPRAFPALFPLFQPPAFFLFAANHLFLQKNCVFWKFILFQLPAVEVVVLTVTGHFLRKHRSPPHP